jgi:hypothetical protein
MNSSRNQNIEKLKALSTTYSSKLIRGHFWGLTMPDGSNQLRSKMTRSSCLQEPQCRLGLFLQLCKLMSQFSGYLNALAGNGHHLSFGKELRGEILRVGLRLR